MSSSSNYSETSIGSTNLTEQLKKFRYKRREQSEVSSPDNVSQKSEDFLPMSPPNQIDKLHVPETPDSDLPSPSSPVVRLCRPKKKSCKRLQSEDSEDDENTVIGDFDAVENGPHVESGENLIRPGKRVHVISSSEDESPLPPSRNIKRFHRLLTEEEDEAEEKADAKELGSSNVARIESEQFKKAEPVKASEGQGIVFVSDESSDESTVKDHHVHQQDYKHTKANNDIPLKNALGKKTENVKKKKLKEQKRPSSEESSEDENDEVGINEIYNSDDSDFDQTENRHCETVMEFLNTSPTEELLRIPGCKKNKVLMLMELRPFTSWQNLIFKLKQAKHLSTDLLNVVFRFLQMQKVIVDLMNRCEKISQDIEVAVSQLKEGKYEFCLTEQPRSLNSVMHLAPHQLLSLNWLILMHHKKLNGILADEMGLGKTVQAIAFLTYLFDEGLQGPHLIVVPSSTLDNWVRELNKWSKKLKVVSYCGNQEERRYIRHRLLRGKDQDVNVIVTTYNVVMSSAEDRVMIKSFLFHYVIFDEAHMLKNINSLRYKNLMKIKADHRMLLTGTPLQNNLAELMSLLIFVMPKMFDSKVDEIRKMFGNAQKNVGLEGSRFDHERIEQAKQIMKPFVLRRLKTEVLQDLPIKTERVEFCSLSEKQEMLYNKLVAKLSRQLKNSKSENKQSTSTNENMMMQLRKLANHPLLMRFKYTDNLLKEMSKKMLKEPTHRDANPELIFEDMQVMSDFELHRLCNMYKVSDKFLFKSILRVILSFHSWFSPFKLKSLDMHKLPKEAILNSGKFQYLDSILNPSKAEGDRVLLFSQFTTMLDIVEEYLAICNHSFIRLDGSTNVKDRQELVDRFNSDRSIFIFLLSTKAGGLGINLTSANVVILHDIDFNPYNDKQAEDRCHRMGQTREVSIIRLISKNTIEELMLQCATDKLQLQHKLATTEDKSGKENKVLISLLQAALDLK